MKLQNNRWVSYVSTGGSILVSVQDFGQLWIWVQLFDQVRELCPPETFIENFRRAGDFARANFWEEKFGFQKAEDTL